MTISLPLLNRMLPTLLAQDILGGVQPMTGPTGLIYSLRAKYGSSPRVWPRMEWDCAVHFDHKVIFHSEHPAREVSQDVLMWAMQHCKGLYAYTIESRPQPLPLDPTEPNLPHLESWHWSFVEVEDAIWFKLRWL